MKSELHCGKIVAPLRWAERRARDKKEMERAERQQRMLERIEAYKRDHPEIFKPKAPSTTG